MVGSVCASKRQHTTHFASTWSTRTSDTCQRSPRSPTGPRRRQSLRVRNILRFALLLSEVAKLAPQLGGHAHAHSSNNHAGTRGSGTVGNVLSKFLCSHYSRVPCSARRMAEKFCQGKKIVAVHENEAGGGKRDGLPVCVQHGSGPQAF